MQALKQGSKDSSKPTGSASLEEVLLHLLETQEEQDRWLLENVAMAGRVEEVIRDKDRFARTPGAGHWRKNLTDEAVNFFAVYSSLIVYRPKTEHLQVVAILHSHRDVERILKNRL
jgi:plasmid stabilization system protein ParE